tara:strand:- start:2119 stop:4368 length:2250 start_codon:yes stop_codon:yes gene_type:complete
LDTNSNLINKFRIPIIIIDLEDFVINDSNSFFVEIFGQTKGKKIYDVFDEFNLDDFKKFNQQQKTYNLVVQASNPLKNFYEIKFEITECSITGILTDVSQFIKNEKMAESFAKHYKNEASVFFEFFQNINDAALIADVKSGIIIEANQAAGHLWNKKVSKIVGTHQSKLHPPHMNEEAKQIFEKHIELLTDNKTDVMIFPILRSDNTEIMTEISSSLMEIGNQTIILGIFRDITKRIEIEDQIRDYERHHQLSSHLSSLGTLTAGIAHELNSPLMYVFGNLEFIKKNILTQNNKSIKLINALDAVVIGCGYISEIISDLSSISVTDDYQKVSDVNKVIRVAAKMASVDSKYRAKLKIDIERELQASISPSRLSQVILNIITNSSRSFKTPDIINNFINIEVKSQNKYINITISDNGKGIAEGDLEKIWAPFYTKNNNLGGRGLGLYISRKILTDIGGQISLESKLNSGTIVKISIPETDYYFQPPKLPLNNNEINYDLKNRAHIVILDDNRLVLDVCEQYLKPHFSVTTYTDPQLAINDAKNDIKDFYISDIMMPTMDAMQFQDKLFKLGIKGSSILFMTGGVVTEEAMKFEKTLKTDNRIVYKPINFKKLIQLITHSILKNQKLQTDNLNSKKTVNSLNKRFIGINQKIYTELLEVLGEKNIIKKYLELHNQIEKFVSNYQELEASELMDNAHNIAGTAAFLGAQSISSHLKKIEANTFNDDKSLISFHVDKIISSNIILKDFINIIL